MDINQYEGFIAQVSQELAGRFLTQESPVAEHARFIDADIAELARHIGLETTKCIYEQMLTQHVNQKKAKDLKSSAEPPLSLT